MAEKSVHYLIRIRTDGEPDRVEDLLGASYVVGRGDPGLQVDFEVPNDEHLSRSHCRLVRLDGGYAVDNLSPNGTYVNGKLIEERRPLKNRDKVALGSATTLEYFSVGDVERGRLLAVDKEKKADEGEAKPGKKGLFSNPLVLTAIAVYAVVGVVIFAMLGKQDKKVKDPGDRLYFQAMLTERLPLVEESSADTRASAMAMWARTKREHGGELLKSGPHAYLLIQRARQALRLLGFTTLRDAVDQKHEIGIVARDALSELETRVRRLYREGKELLRDQQYADAWERYAAIRDSVPDRYMLIRQYAADRARRLARFRRKG